MKIFVTSKMFLHDFLLKLPSSCKCDWRFPLTSNIFNYKRKHGISSLYHGIKQQVFWYQGVVTKMEIFKSCVLLQNKFRVQMGHCISASSNLLLLCLTHILCRLDKFFGQLINLGKRKVRQLSKHCKTDPLF